MYLINFEKTSRFLLGISHFDRINFFKFIRINKCILRNKQFYSNINHFNFTKSVDEVPRILAGMFTGHKNLLQVN